MHEQEEPGHNRVGQREEETHADLSAGTAPPGQREPGCPPARASGSRTAVLQCRALPRATPTEEDASRSGPGRAARALARSQKQERATAFGALREQYGFSEYGLHAFAKTARVCWLADHLDAVLAQTLATRAYQALNRVCLGQARRVRAQRAKDAAWEASRTSATIPTCALCSKNPQKASRDC